jgi:starch phosphorylase
LHSQLQQQGAPSSEIKMANEVLEPKALTIVFARRFTEYKRPTLILHDSKRLLRLLTNRDRPVQIVFAGKAHPDDKIGKQLIRQIVHFVKRKRLHRQVVFIEDYDITLARYLVQGADIWLNTPRRPLEACGTSGMKAAANGVLNISVLDGWWAEAYQPSIGWATGREEDYEDYEHQDEVESQSIYDLLEREIIPLFYDRDDDGLPRGWIRQMKAAMRTICPEFSSARMVREYCQQFYTPAAEQYQHWLSANNPW